MIHCNDANVFIKKEDGNVVVVIDSCHATFNNKQLDEFIKALKYVKVYGGRL